MSNEDYNFDEDTLKYCQHAYDEAVQRNDDLRDININNRLFYEGIDKDLEDRKNDPNVSRSAIFVPLLKPAIDTRISDPVTRVDERECPITLKPLNAQATGPERDAIAQIEYRLNRQLRESGYLTDGFREHIQGAEIYRTPSAVKVGWERVYVKKAVVKVRMKKFMGLPIIPTKTVEFVTEESGRPYAEWLYPDEFLYQPNRSRFADHEYAIHRMWKCADDLRAMGQALGWDMKKVEKAIKEVPADDKTEENDSMRDQIEKEKGTAFREGYRDDKILAYEVYSVTYADSGDEIVKVATILANKYIVKKQNGPKGIRFPFVLLTANRLPGTTEGLSSVDIGRPHQRLYNELANLNIDGLAYRMFPPMLQRMGNNFVGTPKLGLGRLWKMIDISPAGIRPLVENQGMAPDLLPTMQIVAENLRNVLNAPSNDQGQMENPYEKAASVKLRSFGAAKRSAPYNKQCGLALVEIAEMFISYNQQMAKDGADWVVNVSVDCPSLTAITDPETEKQDWMLLFSTASAPTNPLYLSPMGQTKLRNIWEEVMRKFVKEGVERFIPTPAEMQQQITDQANMQTAMMQKQSIAEQIALESQGGANAPAQGPSANQPAG